VFLSLDTSTLTLSLALLERRSGLALEVVGEVTEGPPRKQSEMLPGVIRELLARCAVRWRDLEGMAIGLGPGSFTGLRIGLATLKALAYSEKLPLVGVSSLAAVALEGPEGRTLRPCAVARLNELYVGHYRREGKKVIALGPEVAMTPAELAALLSHEVVEEAQTLALGPALGEYGQRLLDLGVSSAQLSVQPSFPSARAIGELAVFPAQYDEQALFSLEPHYVRASEAERNPKFPPLPGPAPTARIKDD
jgi:tRNA threonylcarbamoyladenosine biosynthesis protein TsaB